MQTTTKRIWLWASYDFANSLAYMVVSFYFALWLVSEKGASSIFVTVPVVLVTIALFFSLPTLGAMSDRIGRRMPFLWVFTLLTVLSLFALGVVAARTAILGRWSIFFIAFLYFLFQYFYQASLGFYYALLPTLTGNRTIEVVSGFGQAAGQLGNVAALALAIPIAQGKMSLLGVTGRPGTFLLGAVAFLLVSLPALVFLREGEKSKNIGEPGVISSSFKRALADLKNLRAHYPNVLTYLVTFYLFADAILTIQLFGTLYLDVVGKMSDGQKTLVGVVMLLCGALGAALSGKMARALRNTKQAIALCIGLWSVVLAITALASSPTVFIILSVFNGFISGSLFALSRAFFSQLVPDEKQGEFFGIYVLFARFASVLGPLVWSLTIFLLASLGEATSYRFAVLSQGLLVGISFITLRFVREPKKTFPVVSEAI